MCVSERAHESPGFRPPGCVCGCACGNSNGSGGEFPAVIGGGASASGAIEFRSAEVVQVARSQVEGEPEIPAGETMVA